MRVALVALALTTASCQRACVERAPAEPTAHTTPATPPPPPHVVTARCVEEFRHAAVVRPTGSGPVDALAATCRAGTLAVFAVRAHTLSRSARPTAPGSAFSPPRELSTGVDRMGPVAPDAVLGPVAWRSPVLGEADERDDVWAATLSDDGARVLRGDALMPTGAVGVGVVFPTARTAAGVEVLASVGREGVGLSTARVRVALDRDEPTAVTELTAAAPGELKAWEFARGVGLARVEDAHGAALELTWSSGGARARHALATRHALVAPRGAASGATSVFAVGEFELGRGDAGACVAMGEGMCVRPGALYLLVAGAAGEAPRRVRVDRGLPDAVTARGDEVYVLYLAGDGAEAEQRAARVDLARGEVTPLALTPPEGFGAIDGPQLVACDDGVWVVAEVSAPDGAERGAVTALPLECLAR